MAEALGEAQIFFVPGDCINVRQHLVDAAVFLAEHPLHLVVGQPGGDLLAPVAAADQDFAGAGANGAVDIFRGIDLPSCIYATEAFVDAVRLLELTDIAFEEIGSRRAVPPRVSYRM